MKIMGNSGKLMENLGKYMETKGTSLYSKTRPTAASGKEEKGSLECRGTLDYCSHL
jgi:hypothetical protein